MSTTMVYPGGAPNTFVPSTEATRNMIVDFSRNIQSFPLNRYMYLVPVTKMVGIYTRMTIEEAGRLLNTGEDMWALGTPRPRNAGRTEKFEMPAYRTVRRQFGYEIPGEAAEQASWDILAQHGRIIAQRAMTRRTERAATLLQTAGNWPAANTIDVDAIPSMGSAPGQWDASTTARLAIKKSIRYGIQVIKKQTLGAVRSSRDLKLVIGDDTAGAMSESQEIADMVKGSPTAIDYIKNKLGPNAYYGLPQFLYGVEVIVEDTVKVTSKKGATDSRSFVWDGDKACLLYRAAGESGAVDDGLAGPEDSNEAPTFSTVTQFMYEEMTVESKYDADDRLNLGRIVENYDTVLTAPISGFLFTDVLT